MDSRIALISDLAATQECSFESSHAALPRADSCTLINHLFSEVTGFGRLVLLKGMSCDVDHAALQNPTVKCGGIGAYSWATRMAPSVARRSHPGVGTKGSAANASTESAA